MSDLSIPVRVAAARSWGLDVATAMSLARDPEPEVLIALARNEDVTDPRVIAQLLRVGLWQIREEIAVRTDDPGILSDLSRDPRMEVRASVAWNRYTPVRDLVRLLEDEEDLVREMAWRNPSSPPEEVAISQAATR